LGAGVGVAVDAVGLVLVGVGGADTGWLAVAEGVGGGLASPVATPPGAAPKPGRARFDGAGVGVGAVGVVGGRSLAALEGVLAPEGCAVVAAVTASTAMATKQPVRARRANTS